MKKLLLAAVMTAMMAPSALAYTVGYVDTQQLFKETKSIKRAQEEIRQQEDRYRKQIQHEESKFQRELNERQKKVEDARKAGKEAEAQKLTEQYTKELGGMRERLQRLTADLTKKAQDLNASRSVKVKAMVESAIKKIAASKKIDLVIDKQAVFYGGVDLTKDVVRQLNGK